MSLAAGTKLGQYEILAPLGAGGMGEVWRARDSRLGREVAIKVLPEEVSSDRERIGRFEREARAASALNHPNIVTIHEVGEAQGRAYLVMERIEGQTLAEILHEGPLPIRRLLSIAAQAADGLARAHEGGIVHRDLKPQNLMVTKDGFVKILDFGLAKLTSDSPMGEIRQTAISTVLGTQPGLVLGTVGYMSPEQASGKPLDHRSDQFSLGAILYEMATGRRAFQRNTPVETLSAIIREEPEPVGSVSPLVPAPLRWTIERCLAKDPEDRYVSTRDLARDLAAVRDHLSETTFSAGAASTEPLPRRSIFWPSVAGVFSLVVIALVFLLWNGRTARNPLPSFRRLTFRRGHVYSARFAPDGRTIVYGAAWDGDPVHLFSASPGSAESVPFAFPAADVLSISSSGQLALSLNRHFVSGWVTEGTLAQAAMSANAPRPILDNVLAADWAPDGSRMAVVHRQATRTRLEFPIGHPLFETDGWLSHPRVSPRGDSIAVVLHPIWGDDAGTPTLVDLAGRTKALSEQWLSAQGLAWSGDDEIWYTASSQGIVRNLYAVTLRGRRRIIASVAGTLQDLARDGRVLLTRDNVQARILFQAPGDAGEQDLSWLDGSLPADLSADGKTLLFGENIEGGGISGSVYVRQTDGSPPVRLGDGSPLALSPDRKWALTTLATYSRLSLVPIGTGEARTLDRGSIESYESARFLPDGKRILISGSERNRRARLFLQDLAGGVPQPLTAEGEGGTTQGNVISPDEKYVTGPTAAGGYARYSIEGGAAVSIPGIEEGEAPIQWSEDGRSLYVGRLGGPSAVIYKLDLASGAREPWKELKPSERAGVNVLISVVITPDGKAYAYGYGRTLSDLYLVEGLK